MNITSPLTGLPDVTLLKVINTVQLINDWKNNFKIDITEELYGEKEIYLYQCNQTKLKFFYPYYISGSSKLYEHLQKIEWYYMDNKWEYQVAIKNLLDCSSVLEIGSGLGAFVKLGIEKGLNIKGIELNKQAVELAQKKHLPVEFISLEKMAEWYPQSVDALCSFQVLEHISNPKDFIELSLQLLKHNGKLILCVPNSESFIKYQYNLLDMPPHHMTQWSISSFKSIEKIFKIQLEKIIKEPLALYHVSGYLHTYSNYFRSNFPAAKLIFNSRTLPVYAKLLNSGMRNILVGQSLYVQFRKA